MDCFLWAAFTAYTRVYLGVHFISDIIAGVLAGAFFGAVMYVVCSYFNGRRICRSNAAAGLEMPPARRIRIKECV